MRQPGRGSQDPRQANGSATSASYFVPSCAASGERDRPAYGDRGPIQRVTVTRCASSTGQTPCTVEPIQRKLHLFLAVPSPTIGWCPRLVWTIPCTREITPDAEPGMRPVGGERKPRAPHGGHGFSPPRPQAAATPHRERADSARQRETTAPTVDLERKRPRPRSPVQTALGRPRRHSRISAPAGRPRNPPAPIHAPRSAAADYPPNRARHRRPCAVSTPENRVGLRSSRRRSSFPGPQSRWHTNDVIEFDRPSRTPENDIVKRGEADPL